MILAAGLTPAWQQILVFERFQAGQVNRAREAHWCASGKVLNVGTALHCLACSDRRTPGADEPPQTLALIGGTTGEAIRREFAGSGIAARWIESVTATRVCTTILDQATGTTTELVENSAPPTAGELQSFSRAFAAEAAQASTLVLTGSLPAGVPQTFCRELLEQAMESGHQGAMPDSPLKKGDRHPPARPVRERLDKKREPVPFFQRAVRRVVLDVRGPELLEALVCRPLLVKPNREELARTVGRDLSDESALWKAMHDLRERGAEWVVVSAGKEPLRIASPVGEHRLVPPAIEVVNPIGCGDCLAAGIAWALDAGREPLDAIRFGLGAAADNLRQLLPARLDAVRIAHLADTVQVL